MNPRRATAAFAAAAGIVVALSGCGTSPTVTATSPTTTAAAAPSSAVPTVASPADEEAAVRETYDAYNQSLIQRDFATTCAILTDEAAQQISTAIAQNGGPANLTCEKSFETIYGNAEAAAQLDEAAKSLKITDVTVTGDKAVVTYGGSVGGQTVSDLKSPLMKIDGKWRVQPSQ